MLWGFSFEWLKLACLSRQLMCIFVSVLCAYSHPLKTCLWALVAWTRVDPLLSPLTVTTCPLRVWSAVALQPPICRTRWMDRCLVSHLIAVSTFPSCLSPFFPSPSVSVSLELPSNTTELWGRLFCGRMMSPIWLQLWCRTWTLFDCGYQLYSTEAPQKDLRWIEIFYVFFFFYVGHNKIRSYPSGKRLVDKSDASVLEITWMNSYEVKSWWTVITGNISSGLSRATLRQFTKVYVFSFRQARIPCKKELANSG